jgi:hypothetical protein
MSQLRVIAFLVLVSLDCYYEETSFLGNAYKTMFQKYEEAIGAIIVSHGSSVDLCGVCTFVSSLQELSTQHRMDFISGETEPGHCHSFLPLY